MVYIKLGEWYKRLPIVLTLVFFDQLSQECTDQLSFILDTHLKRVYSLC